MRPKRCKGGSERDRRPLVDAEPDCEAAGKRRQTLAGCNDDHAHIPNRCRASGQRSSDRKAATSDEAKAIWRIIAYGPFPPSGSEHSSGPDLRQHRRSCTAPYLDSSVDAFVDEGESWKAFTACAALGCRSRYGIPNNSRYESCTVCGQTVCVQRQRWDNDGEEDDGCARGWWVRVRVRTRRVSGLFGRHDRHPCPRQLSNIDQCNDTSSSLLRAELAIWPPKYLNEAVSLTCVPSLRPLWVCGSR